MPFQAEASTVPAAELVPIFDHSDGIGRRLAPSKAYRVLLGNYSGVIDHAKWETGRKHHDVGFQVEYRKFSQFAGNHLDRDRHFLCDGRRMPDVTDIHLNGVRIIGIKPAPEILEHYPRATRCYESFARELVRFSSQIALPYGCKGNDNRSEDSRFFKPRWPGSVIALGLLHFAIGFGLSWMYNGRRAGLELRIVRGCVTFGLIHLVPKPLYGLDRG